MINFNDFFDDSYQFALKELSYVNIHNDIDVPNLNLIMSDTINTTVSDKWLKIVYGRKLTFEPETLYALNVEFEISISFKDSVDPNTIKIDWNKELIETENPYIANITSRISHLISAITSSSGQQPVITPPIPMFDDK